ncbi:hypothetical protein DQ354_16460 [Arthrobacter sp. AQ5-06]|nr:hypothetical protein DQ354_16460 [Arthrobacter sp. AQ5-06]
MAAAPYSCTWDSRTVADGQYYFRAILTDGTGKETISATVTARRVDNSPLRGADIQAGNATGIPGRLDAGDTLSFTYSQQINLVSVTPGWTGAALPVTVRLRDGNILGLGNGGDTLDIQRPGSTVNLGTVNTKGNFAKNRKTVTFNATMTATTVTTAGFPPPWSPSPSAAPRVEAAASEPTAHPQRWCGAPHRPSPAPPASPPPSRQAQKQAPSRGTFDPGKVKG